MKSMQKEKGFTIIEVVLVLAIAGLIFLIVFLAVPALQRGQRDQQRKQDVGRVVAAVQDWKSNHRGANPTATDLAGPAVAGSVTAGAFYTGIGDGSSFEDPSGGPYKFVTTYGTGKDNTVNGELLYAFGNICNSSGNAMTTTGAGARNFAVLMKLESGDSYCQSN
jgi:prepilin-type N-terminal cleavage/methylation domain-containing protein